MILNKVKYLLLHVVIAIHNFNSIYFEFASRDRLIQFFVRVIVSLEFKFAVHYQWLKDSNRL